MLVQMGRVPINYLPARGDEDDDKAIVEISGRIRDVMYEEAEIDDILSAHASWFVTVGNSFLLPYYDQDNKYGTTTQPLQICKRCQTESSSLDIVQAGGKCPKCGNASFDNSPNEQKFALGAFRTDVCSPFEIRLDHRTIKHTEHRRFTRMQMWDLDFAKEKYTDIANQITADHENDLGQFYLNALAHVTSAFGLTGGFVGGATNPTGPKTVVYNHYELPDEHYPQGIKAIRVGANSDLIVEAGPLDSEYGAGPKKGQKFLPLVHFRFDVVPGRYWGRTRADDLVPQQMWRNQIEAVLRLTTQRSAAGHWLLPKGSGVISITGEPGQMIDYNPVSVGGSTFAKPEEVPPELGGTQALIMLQNKIDDTMERLMGTYFLNSGESPPGVTAACQSADTECLTDSGWKTYDQIVPGKDKLFSLDMKTGEGVWSELKDVHIYPDFQGRVIEFTGRELAAISTPNHNWPARIYDQKAGQVLPEITPVRTDELARKHVIVGAARLQNTKPIYKNEWIEFLGWFFAEGNYSVRKAGTIRHDKRGDYTIRTDDVMIEISQSTTVNPINVKAIRRCLNKNGFQFSESVDKRTKVVRFRMNGVKSREIRDQFPNKLPSYDFLSQLTGDQANLLMETLLRGDGSLSDERDGRPHHARVFNTANKELLERFQWIATLAGFETNQLKPYFNSKKHKGPQYSDTMFRCSVKKAKQIWFKQLIKKNHVKVIENYKGLVWCPETESGTWVARKTGRVMLTCNSALTYLGEKAQRAMASPAREWATGWKRWEAMGLEIFRTHAVDQRIITVAGRNRNWEVTKFTQAELQGAVKMKIDYNGIFPKSIATERQNIFQLTQMGYVSPLDPEMAFHVLEKFGETDLKGSMDKAVRQATKENEKFMEDPQYVPELVPIIQNSDVHLEIHQQLTETDEFMSLPPERKQQFYQHIMLTFQDMTTKQQFMAQLAAQAQGGAQPGQQGQQGAQGNKPPEPPPTPDIAMSVGQNLTKGGATASQQNPLSPSPESPLPVQ